MKKNIKLLALIFAVIFTFTGCSKLDVIGKKSISSLEDILNNNSSIISSDERYGGWSIEAPDSSARFIWSKNFSESPLYDVMIELDVSPFIMAGLNVNQLPSDMIVEDKIIIGKKLGNNNMTYESEATPIEAYKNIVNLYPDSIGYHEKGDHFGVEVGNGNMFEWARYWEKNDKDIVFVLNPQMFIDAGVDPEKLEGWKFAKVEAMDMSGKMIEVDKFLKPIDLGS